MICILQINHVNTKLSSPTEEPLSVVTPQKPKAVSQENGSVICADDVHIIETSCNPVLHTEIVGCKVLSPPPPARIDDWWSAIYMDSEMLIVDPLHVDCWSDRVDVNPPLPPPLPDWQNVNLEWIDTNVDCRSPYPPPPGCQSTPDRHKNSPHILIAFLAPCPTLNSFNIVITCLLPINGYDQVNGCTFKAQCWKYGVHCPSKLVISEQF